MAGGVTAKATLYKQPGEKRKYGIDFANLLGTDGLSPINSITYEKVGQDSSTDLSITASGISGTQVQFWVESGVHGSRYRIEAAVTTSGTAILEGDGILVVKDR